MTDHKDMMRRQIADGLRRNGLAPADVDIAVDLAFHATDQALRSFALACDSVEGIRWLNAYGIGLQLLEQAASRMAENFRETAKIGGLRTSEFVVGAAH